MRVETTTRPQKIVVILIPNDVDKYVERFFLNIWMYIIVHEAQAFLSVMNL